MIFFHFIDSQQFIDLSMLTLGYSVPQSRFSLRLRLLSVKQFFLHFIFISTTFLYNVKRRRASDNLLVVIAED